MSVIRNSGLKGPKTRIPLVKQCDVSFPEQLLHPSQSRQKIIKKKVSDSLKWERWEKQIAKIRKPNPICKCGETMEWYKSDTYGYYYRCLACGKKKRRKYYHEFYTDRKGRPSLKLKLQKED